MGFQSAGIGPLCSWDRSSAGGLAVLFAGVGFFCGTAGAMPNEIGILLLECRSCVVGLVVCDNLQVYMIVVASFDK